MVNFQDPNVIEQEIRMCSRAPSLYVYQEDANLTHISTGAVAKLWHAFDGIFMCVVSLRHLTSDFIMSIQPSTSQLGIPHHSAFRVERHQRGSPLPLDNMGPC